MKQLKPIEYSTADEKRLERDIFDIIKDIMWKDVLAILKRYNQKAVTNAKGALQQAIQTGKIQYTNGEFSGKFNASTSRELKNLGAKYDKRTKTWKLEQGALPPSLISAVVIANERFKRLYSDVIEALNFDNMAKRIEEVDLTPRFEKTLGGLEKQFVASTKTIGLKPQLSKEMVETLSSTYNENMKLYIKDWLEPNILKLREQVSENAFAGARAESLIKDIEKEYGVSKRKAKFLARQETTLITGQFTKERYKSAGVTKYRWSTSNDSRVRSAHAELHGKIFMWDEAIIDEKGTRGNPKEAFGCRCKALAIVD